MINIFKSLLSSVKINDDNFKYNDIYKNTVVTIQKLYTETKDSISEAICTMVDEYNSMHKEIKRPNILINKFSVNPEILCICLDKLNELLDSHEINKYADNDNIDTIIFDKIKLSKEVLDEQKIVKNIFNTNNAISCTFDNAKQIDAIVCKIIHYTYILRDNLYKTSNIIIKACDNIDSTLVANYITTVATYIFTAYKQYCACYINAYTGITTVFKEKENILTESVSDEDVSSYLDELNKMIPEIRAYWDKYKYKDIIIPRKKHIEKMKEYMRGALDRKYTLKIPMYKVEGHIKDVQSVVNNFISSIKFITNKYPNYIVMAPSFDDSDDDKFIYITLKEPFGEKSDRKDRETQSKIKEMNESSGRWENPEYDKVNDDIDMCRENMSKIGKEITNYEVKHGYSSKELQQKYEHECDILDQLVAKRHKIAKTMMNESALSVEDKQNIPESEYGLPDICKYPMPDKKHVIKAIQFFYACSPEKKQELATNIERRIVELGLVGKVVINKANKNREYFSDWVTDKSATVEKNGDKYTVTYDDGKSVIEMSFKPITESAIEFIL